MILRLPVDHRVPSNVEDFSFTLAMELLRTDPLFYKIPLRKAPDLVGFAIRTGETVALEVIRTCGTNEPLHIARQMDVRILFDITHYPARPVTMLSQYKDTPPTIIIYEAALRECRENIAKWELKSKFLLSELTNICVCHELYHHVERATHSFAELAHRVPVVNLGFLKIEKSIKMVGEIAAHAFVKKMLNLAFLPCVLDRRLFEMAVKRSSIEPE